MTDAQLYAQQQLELARKKKELNDKRVELETNENKISQLKQEIEEIQNNPFKSLDFNF